MNRQDRSCHSKKAYLSEIEAMIVARKREGSGAPMLRVYRCQYCGLFHMTKTPLASGT